MSYEMSQLQTKQATLRGLMGSKNTASLISDALKSPMGSTSRKRAQKIVNLMKKYRSTDGFVADGRGGPGYETIEQQNPMSQASMGEVVIFPSPPEMRIPLDGRGGPGFTGIGASAAVPNALSNLQNFSGVFGAPSTVPTPQNNPPAQQPQSGGFNIPALQSSGGLSMATAGSTQPSTQPSFSGGLPQTGATPTQKMPWEKLSIASTTAPELSAFQVPQSSSGTATPGTLPEVGGSTGAATPQAYPAVQGAVDKNLGPDAFALSMLSNPDAMRHLPGFKDMPSDAIPTGASLAGQIDTLADTLKQEYGLDELLNQKNNMIKNGMTLTTDMTDYIRGRDQFLNQTQGMIDQYTDRMRGMDLANPDVSGRANQYMNYLYELRGRQNKRYIEFLNGSIGMYNAQLADVSNNYDKALSAYESDLNLKASVTQSEYQMYYTALTGMYNAAQQAPILAKQSLLLDAQINATNAQAAKDGANQGKGYLEDAAIISDKGKKALILDDEGLFLPTVNSLSGFIDTVSGDGSVDSANAMQYAVSAMMKGIDTSPDPVTASQLGGKYLGWTADLYKNAASEQDATNATLVRNSIQSTMSNSIKRGVEADTSSMYSLRGDLNSMINPMFFAKGPARTAFVNRYGNLLGRDVANSLWGGVDQFRNEGGKTEVPGTNDPNALASWIADIASDSYVANIWNTALGQNQ